MKVSFRTNFVTGLQEFCNPPPSIKRSSEPATLVMEIGVVARAFGDVAFASLRLKPGVAFENLLCERVC